MRKHHPTNELESKFANWNQKRHANVKQLNKSQLKNV